MLRELQTLRNAYAHGHGRIDAVKEGRQKAIASIVSRRAGIRFVDGILIIDVEGAREYHQFVNRELRDLFMRARAEF
jgi:hypothetical protein